jgi:hypothetical protein
MKTQTLEQLDVEAAVLDYLNIHGPSQLWEMQVNLRYRYHELHLAMSELDKQGLINWYEGEGGKLTYELKK